MSVVRAELHAPAVISIAQRQGMLAVVPTGQSGPPGPMTNWRMSSGWIQARAVGYGGDWTNVVELADITPPMPAHSWSGTQLRFETAPGVWGPYVDLKGDAVEIGVSGGFIRWRPVGGDWTDIVELADLVGPDGPAIEVQTTATHIQWRVVGDVSWIDLVALADITGPQGNTGPVGINLPLGAWDSGTAYVARDVVNKDGSSWICLVGHTNQSPPTLPTTANTYWSLLAKIGDTPTSLDISGVAGLTSELMGSAQSAVTVAATDIVAEFIYDTTIDDDKGAWRHRCAHTSWWQEAASATRGAKREFPQKVKIVARSGVTNPIAIYDITDLNSDGSAKLWWAGGGAAYAPSAGVSTPAAIFALNGRVWIAYAGSSGSLRELDFVSDRYLLYTNSSGSTRRGTGLTTGLGSQNISATVPLLVSRDCNHVTARVYPGAPVDAYGRPIPKVAVATAGGVSVIHEDGSVYDITRSAPGNSRAYFLADGRIAAALASSAQVDILPVPYADATVAAIRQAFYSTVGANLPTLSGTTGALVAAADAVAVGNAQGLSLFLPNPGAESAGMFAYSAVAYATGWQVGDIRGAYLCDTTTGNITGTAELVTNGDFTTDLTGWTQVQGAVAQNSGKLRCTRSSGQQGRASSTITCVVGQTYLLSVDVTNVSTVGSVYVNTSTSITSPVASQVSVSGRVLIQFVATSTTMYLLLQTQGGADGNECDFDNVSVKLAIPDRSYKARGLQVVGTLSRAAVATGADLVWFSGWSGANFLEQPYNPDLDFADADFCVGPIMFKRSATAALETLIMRDSATTGARFGLQIAATTSLLNFVVSDGTDTVTVASSAAVDDDLVHEAIGIMRGTTMELWIDNVLVASGSASAVDSISNTSAILRVGLDCQGSNAFGGSIALVRMSATAPSAAQIARMYRDEAPLFNAGAKACLGGASNAVASMDFDSWSQRLLVGTGDGVSEFSGLVRVGYFDTSNTTLTNDATKAVAAQGGYRSMAGGQQSIVVRDKVSQHDVVNAYPEQLPAAVANELAAIRALALLGTVS